jgi:ring-1,2-phenylacetyl-CoA epoxidase subunit PaaC
VRDATGRGHGARETLLAFADDEHIMGHRHSEWIGIAPFLEEDLAFASIGQDELGHASALYALITDDVEHLALRRPAEEYRSCWLVEAPCRAWEDALVRHLLYDTAERFRWENVAASTVDGLPAIAARALLEEDYHRRHATTLAGRLLDATEESRARIAGAVERLLPLAAALWETVAGEEAAIAAGVVARPSHELAGDWRREIEGLLSAHGVALDWPEAGAVAAAAPQAGRSRRSEHFAGVQAALTEVLSLDPAATW